MVGVRVLAEPKADPYDIQAAHARTAEHLGFDGWFRSEHLIIDDAPGSDALIVLAGIARETTRIRLGTMMVPATFRLPGPLAIQAALLDHMSNGRFELGIGAGWLEREHTALGIDFGGGFRDRFDRLEEQLDALTTLWRAPTPVTYRGRHYELVEAPAIATAQRPNPPIIIGGYGPTRTPALAARFANEFNALRQTPSALVEVFRRVSSACEKSGRDPADLCLSAAVVVCGGDTSADVRRRIEASSQDPQKLAVTGATGTSDEVLTSLRQYVNAGAQRIYLRLFDLNDLDHLAWLATKVIPGLRAL